MAAVVPQAYPTPATLAADNIRLAFHIAKFYARRARALGLTREDLQQEAVVGLLRASHGFNPTLGTQFSSFACIAVRHHLQNVLTARRFRVLRGLPVGATGTVFDSEDCHTQPPDAAAMLSEGKERVGRLLRLLQARERAIFQMYFWNNMSFAQIGEHVGLSGERVRQIFDRALGRLRRATHAPGAIPTTKNAPSCPGPALKAAR